jgi:hypothetical protein
MTDLFDDISSLMINEAALVNTTTKSASMLARKPARDEWFRVSTEARHQAKSFSIYQPKLGRPYLITPATAANTAMRQVSRPRIIYVAVNRSGEAFLSLVGTGDDDYSTASRAGHQQAQREWIRLVADQPASTYNIMTSEFTEEPEFPAGDYADLLRMAFGETYVINDLMHPVALEIQGLPTRTL